MDKDYKYIKEHMDEYVFSSYKEARDFCAGYMIQHVESGLEPPTMDIKPHEDGTYTIKEVKGEK